MKRAIYFLCLLMSTVALRAMNDSMEVDMEVNNGSLVEAGLSEQHRNNSFPKQMLFRAIDGSSPATKSQTLDSGEADASEAKQESLQELGSCDIPDREVDTMELDLSALAIDSDAMDDNEIQ